MKSVLKMLIEPIEFCLVVSQFFKKYLKCLQSFFQEAKSSCAGQWYLPAGRMEPGEDIIEAAKREVLEETGIHFEPSTLLLVESAGRFRFSRRYEVFE